MYIVCMSVVVRFKNIRLAVFTNDHAPAHVHAIGPDAEAKIELATLNVVWSYGFSAKALHEITAQVQVNQEELLAKWEEYHERD